MKVRESSVKTLVRTLECGRGSPNSEESENMHVTKVRADGISVIEGTKTDGGHQDCGWSTQPAQNDGSTSFCFNSHPVPLVDKYESCGRKGDSGKHSSKPYISWGGAQLTARSSTVIWNKIYESYHHLCFQLFFPKVLRWKILRKCGQGKYFCRGLDPILLKYLILTSKSLLLNS